MSIVNPRDLIGIARLLASGSPGQPSQTELRRAVSSAYYALFHALAQSCADMLAGTGSSVRSATAWTRVYRSLEHGHARNQCDNQSAMIEFPDGIRNFGRAFIWLQGHRHKADYDPEARFDRDEAMLLIEVSNDALIKFENTSVADRRAFAIHVLLRQRRN